MHQQTPSHRFTSNATPPRTNSIVGQPQALASPSKVCIQEWWRFPDAWKGSGRGIVSPNSADITTSSSSTSGVGSGTDLAGVRRASTSAWSLANYVWKVVTSMVGAGLFKTLNSNASRRLCTPPSFAPYEPQTPPQIAASQASCTAAEWQFGCPTFGLKWTLKRERLEMISQPD
uniref:Uncharacterized protein n=1 Tax=Solanum tuberosum TaxID=4113 RepID=M1DW55_SOLTU